MNYYNEHDPFAAEWLRQLMFNGHIPWGRVDERDIQEVDPAELVDYTQCHFFAGIGGWSYALHLAGWPITRPVWTGSPPCQPFSTAGKQLGTDDERHLWPVFFNLIRECRPPTVFGEQVAAAIKTGWFDALQDDMEAEDYACGMVVLPACSVGAPHIRQRLFFIATDTNGPGLPWRNESNEFDQAHETPTWGEFERVHATSTWHAWLSKSGDGVFTNGFPYRVGRLRGYGNAIVPQVAAEVIKAFMNENP